MESSSDRLRKMQEAAMERWKGHFVDSGTNWFHRENKKSSVLTMGHPVVVPDPEPIPEPKVVPEKVKSYMEADPVKHFIKAMEHIGIEIYRYVPKKVKPAKQPKVKKDYKKYPEMEKRPAAEIDPITGKRIYKKRNDPPQEKIIRVRGEYSNVNVRAKYGL